MKIEENNVPHDIKVNFQFYGLDRHKNPDSIIVRMFELSNWKLVNERYASMWEITDPGRIELEKYLNKKYKIMVDENTLLRYFYKQNKKITLDDLFKRFEIDDSILKPIGYLLNNDWLEELETFAWQITGEGKAEFERLQKFNTPQPTNSFIFKGGATVINMGKVEGDIMNNLINLNDSGHQGISKNIRELMEAIKNTNEIQEHEKAEYLETLNVLSGEAVKPKDERLPSSTIKKIIQFGLGSLNTMSSISTIAGVNLKDVAEYFLEP